jgi:hypothetical protein
MSQMLVGWSGTTSKEDDGNDGDVGDGKLHRRRLKNVATCYLSDDSFVHRVDNIINQSKTELKRMPTLGFDQF